MTHRTQPQQAPAEVTGAAEAAGATEAAEAAALRYARFGALPERIRPQDTVETKPATPPDPARDRYHADEWLVRYCA